MEKSAIIEKLIIYKKFQKLASIATRVTLPRYLMIQVAYCTKKFLFVHEKLGHVSTTFKNKEIQENIVPQSYKILQDVLEGSLP